ncbi:HD-GYP domain-containing protein [Syntrophobacter fumaroxidans]|uniref:Response regulator receiver modulated metal dependent phosphohydrolase n=1 Tax=Syntrophobacter fumaroxidans (strain DSM 10017 / MPOB) TaxID=335543 RepID=A0LPQ6_SYNFM|nr:HD domain-containing phosphohydrolase [Syntrophobacter fumaroxidans]ABK19408.1 response regulator receiver modulated metal dependent phosphohydrolase [Syntrophobacter fumaroxidans MPOB]
MDAFQKSSPFSCEEDPAADSADGNAPLMFSGCESIRAMSEALRRAKTDPGNGGFAKEGLWNRDDARVIRRLLVVDDEDSYRTLIKNMGERFGIACEAAADAGEAMEMLRRNAFDLVLSDIRMRGMDGLTLMRRAQKEFPQLDFVIMTGFVPDYSYSEIIAAGAADFIAKPFQVGELEAKLDRITREKLILRQLRETLMEIVEVLTSALEIRDPYTAGHQRRVARLAQAIAAEMGLTEPTLTAVRMAGLVHDIGKISVPSQILSKPTQLHLAEIRLIREHSEVGYEILKKAHFPWPIARIVHQHHERLDGSGYPRQLTGDEILLEAKILAVADVVEAMSSHRPYRAAIGLATALEEIGRQQGRLYDQRAVQACLRIFCEKEFRFD